MSEHCKGEEVLDRRWRPSTLGITVVLITVGSMVGFARGAYDLVGVTPRPILGAVIGGTALVSAIVLTSLEIRKRYPDNTLARNSLWLTPIAGLCLFAAGTVLRQPLVVEPLMRMEGRTNIALVDFVPKHPEGVVSGADINLPRILLDGVSGLHESEGVSVNLFSPRTPMPLTGENEVSVRDSWVAEFVEETDAHVVVGGRYEQIPNSVTAGLGRASDPGAVTESAVELVIYVRPDAIPDAPELARWIEAGRFVTLADISGGRFGRTSEESLASEMAEVVADLTRFIEATDSMRAGRPRDAAEELERLAAASTSTVIPAEFIHLYRGSALVLASDLVDSDDLRDVTLGEAEAILDRYRGQFARADFLLAEIELKRTVLETGACTAATDIEALAEISEQYGDIAAEGLDPVTSGKIALGALKADGCRAIAAFHLDASRANWESIRSTADLLVDELLALDEPNRSAADPVIARALTVWPELVMLDPGHPLLDEALANLSRSLQFESRPERRMTTWLSSAVLNIHECRRTAAEDSIARARGMARLAARQGRVVQTTTDQLVSSIDSYASDHFRGAC